MYRIEKFEEKYLESIVANLKKDQFHYHEYSFLTDYQLSTYFLNKSLNSLINAETKGYVVISGTIILGVLVCTKDNFDSEIFGFGCYRITDLLVFSDVLIDIHIIVDKLLSYLEKELQNFEKPVYIAFSLNNNLHNGGQVFNAITAKKYYYIHTLLTFGSEKEQYHTKDFYEKENLIIRKVNSEDVFQVSDIAQKSFKFSRFHLDPFLDNNKSSELLRTSAINSIENSYVDIMFVAEINGKVVGYYSGKKTFIKEFNKTLGEAVISAVDADYRGLGIFSKLDSHLLNWFSANSDFAEMGTYLVNSPVHKTWTSKGLKIIRGTHQFSKLLV